MTPQSNHISLLTLVMTFTLVIQQTFTLVIHRNKGPSGPAKTGGVSMTPGGYNFNGCDNGVVQISVDWNPGDKDVFKCKEHDKSGKVKTRAKGSSNVIFQECQVSADEPIHMCLPERIVYTSTLPTSGAHRPVWPTYGEYEYIPVQRWLHALEHGAIVFLYHPCVDPQDLGVVKRVAKGCLRRHIISAYASIPQKYNFAMLAWKCKFLFQTPNIAEMVEFIKKHALKGPENVYQNGAYKAGLLKEAEVVSDLNDTILCPTTKQRNYMNEKIKESPFKPEPRADLSQGALSDEEYKTRFEPFKNIVDLSGQAGKGGIPNRKTFQEDLKKGFAALKSEEKKLEWDLKESEEKLNLIRKKLGES